MARIDIQGEHNMMKTTQLALAGAIIAVSCAAATA